MNTILPLESISSSLRDRELCTEQKKRTNDNTVSLLPNPNSNSKTTARAPGAHLVHQSKLHQNIHPLPLWPCTFPDPHWPPTHNEIVLLLLLLSTPPLHHNIPMDTPC